MDYREIYEYRFKELLDTARKISSDLNYSDAENADRIIDVSGNTYREYNRVLLTTESWANNTVEMILVNMLYQSSRSDYELPHFYQNVENKKVPLRVPFVLKRNGKREAYVFRFYPKRGLSHIRDVFKNNTDVDLIHYVLLLKKTNNHIFQLNELEAKEDNSFIHFEIFEDCFTDLFGADEFSVFKEYADNFNENIKNTIGMKMMSLPTDKMVAGFKKKTVDEIKSIDYFSLLNKAENRQRNSSNKNLVVIEEADKQLLFHNYIDGERYKLIVSDNLFSDSFLGSEWLLKSNLIADDVFDITGVVTGYLKSIEQFIYSYIHLYIEDFSSNRWIWYKGKKEEIEREIENKQIIEQEVNFNNGTIRFLPDYEAYFDKTLGSLISFLKARSESDPKVFENSDLFCINVSNVTDLIQFVVKELYGFKDADRNPYSHQNNIYKQKILTKIREDVLLLYFLLVGSFNFSGINLVELGYPAEERANTEISNLELQKRIEKWIYPIVKFNFPKECPIVAFSVMYKKNIWEINVMGLADIPKEKYQTIEWNYRQIKSPELFNYFEIKNLPGDRDYTLPIIVESLKNIINSNTYIGKTLRSYSKILIGDAGVIDILYEQ